jgi:deoxyribonuclease-4
MNKIGLKLWSSNTIYKEEIGRLWNGKIFDFIELYIEPNSVEFIEFWKKIRIPFGIHCAHSGHGFNLSLKENIEKNEAFFEEAYHYFNELNAEYLVLHPGVGGDISTTIEQLDFILKNNNISEREKILIENKPYKTLTDDIAVGSGVEEIRKITGELGIGFCLDITHAVKYSISKKKDWAKVLNEFMKLRPKVIHVSDAFQDNEKDQHLHIGSGDFDFKKMLAICRAEYSVLETVKDSKDSLKDFEEDVKKIKGYF